jgi:hypothetical protein
MGLHKVGTWTIVFIILRKFWKRCLAFCHANFLFPNEKKNVITGSKEIEEIRILFCTYNCFDQRMSNHLYDFFSFYHVGVWVDGVPC